MTMGFVAAVVGRSDEVGTGAEIAKVSLMRRTDMANETNQGPRPNAGKGQQKTYQVTGVNPQTGETLTPRLVTQEEWRTQKLGKQGYEKPADMPEDDGSVEG
jgi:hypothetical protein